VKLSVVEHALDREDEEVGWQRSIIERRSRGAKSWRFGCAFSTPARGCTRYALASLDETACKCAEDADLQGVYGSDGTRTRDLRRDRPVMALPS
jgi:hypothetical protein